MAQVCQHMSNGNIYSIDPKQLHARDLRTEVWQIASGKAKIPSRDIKEKIKS